MKKIFVLLMLLVVCNCIITKNLFAQENEINLEKVFCYRQIEKQSNVLTVTLLINTKGLEREKTLKIKEKFPNGFQCKVKEGYGSTNAVAENSVLFVWSVLPKSELFQIKYELTSPNPLNEAVSIIGNVSFLSETGIKYVSVEQREFMNNTTIVAKIKNIPPYEPGSKAPATVQNTNITMKDVPKTNTTTLQESKIDTISTPKPRPIVRTNVKDEPVKDIVAMQSESKPIIEPIKTNVEPEKKENQNVTELPPVNTNKTTTKTSAPSTTTISTPNGFYYTVQIGASPKPLPNNYYDKYQFEYPVDVLQIDNLYKYSVGKFQTLKEANKYSAVVRQKGLQCFVVAYNNGKKITTNEALSISKQ
ncbi:MAG: SPOR domain-containing protein [Bacteroidales bacterium]